MKETENIELKKSVGEWKEIIETISVEDLTNKILANTDPNVYPKISLKRIDNKDILVIEIKEFHEKPILAFGRPFKRIGKSTVRMSKDEYEKTIIEKHREELRFDNQVCKEARLSDINRDKVRVFLKKAKSERGLDVNPDLPIKEILMRLKLMKDGKLTNSAVLLFGNNPQNFFIQSEAKCVRFKGTDVTGTMIDMKNIGGNLIDQVVEVEKFIFDHISLISWIEDGKIERQERWEYPPRAIREALVNAIAHRDYRSQSKT